MLAAAQTDEIDEVEEPGLSELSRPVTRGDCINAPRPCPYVGCRHHLWLDIRERSGRLILNHPYSEPADLVPGQSCSLDVADRGGHTLEEVGILMGLTRERVRQIEVIATMRLRSAMAEAGIGENVLETLGSGGWEGDPVLNPIAIEKCTIVSNSMNQTCLVCLKPLPHGRKKYCSHACGSLAWSRLSQGQELSQPEQPSTPAPDLTGASNV